MHFTYSDPDLSVLRQGDLLKKTPELLEIVGKIHPHYSTESYLYFQVLTQTCDLVRRKGENSKSRYITLAAVRSLDFVLTRFIDQNATPVKIGDLNFFNDSSKGRVSEFLKKLVNNNDPNHFFLNQEPKLGLNMHCCTHLQLSIAIRSYEHYDTCLGAKFVQLAQPFDAKLGWLVGNLYSRVGTRDFSEEVFSDESQYNRHIEATLSQYMNFLDKDKFAFAKKNSESLSSVTDLIEKMDHKAKEDRQAAIDRVTKTLKKSFQIEDEDKVRNFVSSNANIFKI